MEERERSLDDLRRTWRRREARVRRVNDRIRTRGMTRPPRSDEERRWLEAKGDPGPFQETSAGDA